MSGLHGPLGPGELDMINDNELERLPEIDRFGQGTERCRVLVPGMVHDHERLLYEIITRIMQRVPLIIVPDIAGPDPGEMQSGTSGQPPPSQSMTITLQGEKQNGSIVGCNMVGNGESKGRFADGRAGYQICGGTWLHAG